MYSASRTRTARALLARAIPRGNAGRDPACARTADAGVGPEGGKPGSTDRAASNRVERAGTSGHGWLFFLVCGTEVGIQDPSASHRGTAAAARGPAPQVPVARRW